MSLISINPATEKIISVFEEFTDVTVDDIIINTENNWLHWKYSTFDSRKKCLLKASEKLISEKDFLAKVITSEMGKPIKQAEAEILKCSWVCEYYALNGVEFLKNEFVETDASQSYITYNPLGIILAIMPWNFPFWQVFRFAAPTLMAGNAALLKHSSNVTQCALEIERIFRESGFPENIFRTLQISSSKVKRVIENPLVKAVTLTGSEPAGREVAAISGRNLKKVVLELGGSDPFIIFEDADFDAAINGAVTGRILNNGQSCIAAKRFITVGKAADKFIPGFLKKMESLKIGNPMEFETELGPLAKKEFADELQKQVNDSIKAGAKILTKNIPIPDKGFFFQPMILSEVTKEMPAYSEELFGPVAVIIQAANEDEAVKIANDTSFGLGASLWTSNAHKADRLISQIDSGSVFVNGIVKSDPRLPFGGINNSGYGRELSHYGIKEFVNIKTVWIK
ncbi:MAG: NAD-dependent succinate-semialdehyde dehydrogenase [Ignavibacteria bacterium]|nr:NAD-dependent succinate-semialdehyde dehydrogenase [Ignavibacteria bacterium]